MFNMIWFFRFSGLVLMVPVENACWEPECNVSVMPSEAFEKGEMSPSDAKRRKVDKEDVGNR